MRNTLGLSMLRRGQQVPSPPIPRDITAVSGRLTVLMGRHVLVLADDENLRYGARGLGCDLSMQRLGLALQQVSSRCDLHAFFSREPGDDGRCQYLRECGWIPHPRDIETVQTHRGLERLANCDNDMLFGAGNLATTSMAQVVVLASGDGTLVCDLARNLRLLPRTRIIVTLSLPGSTSSRLDAARNPHVDGNIEIGHDCLE